MPTNAAKKALAKAKRGTVATGACSTKADPNFAALKDNKELPCLHCDRIFKQQDRLKQHIQKQHGDVVAEQAVAAGPGDGAGGDGGGGKKISAKAALIQQQAAKAKEDKAREALEKGEKAPVQRMSCKLPVHDPPRVRPEEDRPQGAALQVPRSRRGLDVQAGAAGQAGQDGEGQGVLVEGEVRHEAGGRTQGQRRGARGGGAEPTPAAPVARRVQEHLRRRGGGGEGEGRNTEGLERRGREARIARAKAANRAEPPAVLTMSEEKRGLVESILRETWVSDDDDDDDGVDLGEGDTDDDDDVNALCDRLTGLGFHREDAMAASKATKSTDPTSLDPAISWLCVHVPETRLPAAYAPQSVNDGGVVLLSKSRGAAGDVAAASSSGTSAFDDDSRPEDVDAAWLWDRGYPRAACEAAASDHGGNRRSPSPRCSRRLSSRGNPPKFRDWPRVVVEATPTTRTGARNSPRSRRSSERTGSGRCATGAASRWTSRRTRGP